MLGYGAMRTIYVSMALAMTLLGCERRTEEAKRLEQKRVTDLMESNALNHDRETYWLTAGEHHTTAIRVKSFGIEDPTALKAAMMEAISNYDGAKEAMEKDGWTHFGFRDKDTGTEIIKPVSELQGIEAASAEWKAAKEAAARPVVPQ